jgi:hypothetical protein
MAQNIADTMAYLQGEGRLLRGEHNHLCEAFLVMASSAGYLATTPFKNLCLQPSASIFGVPSIYYFYFCLFP